MNMNSFVYIISISGQRIVYKTKENKKKYFKTRILWDLKTLMPESHGSKVKTLKNISTFFYNKISD